MSSGVKYILLFIVSLIITPVTANNWFYTSHYHYNTIMSFEYQKPAWGGTKTRTGHATGWASFLNLTIPNKTGGDFLVEIPYGYGLSPYGKRFSRSMGNIMIGFREMYINDRLGFELGVRLPTVGEECIYVHQALETVDLNRCGAFMPNVVTIEFKSDMIIPVTPRNLFYTTLGLKLLYSWGDEIQYENENFAGNHNAYLLYGVGYTGNFKGIIVDSRIRGLSNLNNREFPSGQKTLGNYHISLAHRLGQLMAGVFLEMPLYEHVKIAKHTLGFNCSLFFE